MKYIHFLSEVTDKDTGQVASVFGTMQSQDGYLATQLKDGGKFMLYCTKHSRLFCMKDECKECEVK